MLCSLCNGALNGRLSVIDGVFYCEDCANSGEWQCVYCGTYTSGRNLIPNENGEQYCTECVGHCFGCRHVIFPGHTVEIGAEDFCPSCATVTSVCSRCHRPVYDYTTRYIGGELVCSNCESVNTCTTCGFVTLEVLTDGICSSCRMPAPSDADSVIMPYNYKPFPTFFPEQQDGVLYLGVELEIDDETRCAPRVEAAKALKNLFGEHLYIKHDNSLVSGFEIVTHPATLDYHITQLDWDAVCEVATSYGFRSNSTSTCGLHVHMSRDAFTELALMKFIFIVERFWDKWVTISRRTEESLEYWAARYGEKESIENTYRAATRDYSRRRAVNLQNSNTVEIRLFKGSLNADTVRAALELCSHLHKLACELTIEKVLDLTWDDVIDEVPPSLAGYLEQRGLFPYSVAQANSDR